MKANEMRDLTVTELKARLKDERQALEDMQFNRAAVGQLENPARIRMTKREIARLHTVIHEMENEESRPEETETEESGSEETETEESRSEETE